MSRFSPLVRQLLLCSFMLSISRALVSPLLVLTLGRQLQLGAQQIGLLLGAVLVSATLSGLYAGYLVDRSDRRRLLQGALLGVAAGFALLPGSHQLAMAGVALLLVELAFVLFGIAIKALLSDLLPPAERSRAFSLRYTLANVGYAIGPLLGSWLASARPAWAFVLAAVLAVAALPLLRQVPRGHGGTHGVRPPQFSATLQLLRRDRTLVLFTIGSLLACAVHGRFSDSLSLYLLQRHGDAEVLHWMSALITSNALTVVLCQYWLGRLLRPHNLLRWIMLASLLLAGGLAGFALSPSLWQWCGWMVLFTLGEILLVPAEYLYIDAIAPEHLKGSYYGAQNLAQLGAAGSPMLAGLLITAMPGNSVLWSMLTLTLLGALFVWQADRTSRAPGRAGQRQALSP
ncbi:MFS transporter [Vogesella sp. LIG4]|uniref:MFS transporter n=1 Tax=Vogesella sp. LIG4 TaxID=1192162 RepID=UPI0012FDB07D|nr:MFS transporter [Vogesella sp. LIG4]